MEEVSKPRENGDAQKVAEDIISTPIEKTVKKEEVQPKVLEDNKKTNLEVEVAKELTNKGKEVEQRLIQEGVEKKINPISPTALNKRSIKIRSRYHKKDKKKALFIVNPKGSKRTEAKEFSPLPRALYTQNNSRG